MEKTIIINLYGGPGSGKSTTAAGVFHKLKTLGINCEYIQEYAKDVVWGENFNTLNNQIYVYGKQHNRIFRLKGKVDIIITDAPPVMGMVYSDWTKTSIALKKLAYDEHHKDDVVNVDFFIVRDKPYNPKGRMQNIDEAKEMDTKIKALLGEFDIKYENIIGDKNVVNNIVDYIIINYERCIRN